MPTQAVHQISRIVLAANANTINISNIPQGYRDLKLVITGSMSASASPSIRLNGDATANNYAVINMYGTGSGQGTMSNNSYTQIGIGWWPAAPNVNDPFVAIVDIFDYTQTDRQKNTLSRCSEAAVLTDVTAGRWLSNAAVNSILITGYNGGGQYNAGTIATLYGVLA